MKQKRIFSVFVVIGLVCAVIAVATTRAQAGASTTATETGQVTQATLSAVVESSNPDPAEVTAAQSALSNASAAYKLAQQKYNVNSTDSVALSCNGIDSAKRAYDDAVNAYNSYISNWRVQVNGAAGRGRRRDRTVDIRGVTTAQGTDGRGRRVTAGAVAANAQVSEFANIGAGGGRRTGL